VSRILRIDAVLLPAILVELKTRAIKHEHEIALAGYALAFESQYEVPVDYALIVNGRGLWLRGLKPVSKRGLRPYSQPAL